MSKVHIFDNPVDLSKERMFNYYMNVYKDGKFVEGRHYENYSGNAVMDSAIYLRMKGYTVEW
jgi:hypothetical protein